MLVIAVRNVVDKGVDDSHLDIIIDHCLQLLPQFVSVSFSHVQRDGPHDIVGLAQRFDFLFPKYWLDEVHPCVQSLYGC